MRLHKQQTVGVVPTVHSGCQ